MSYIDSEKMGRGLHRGFLLLSLVPGVLSGLHDSPVGGHQGRGEENGGKFQMLSIGQPKTKDVEKWCASCAKCSFSTPSRAPLQLEDFASRPLERIAMDKRGNYYILVVGDYYTRWKEAFPMKDMDAQTVACILLINPFVIWEFLTLSIQIKGETLRAHSSKSCTSCLLVMLALHLQNSNHRSKMKDNSLTLERCLKLLVDGNVDSLFHEVCTIQSRLPPVSKPTKSNEKLARSFSQLMMLGKIKSALQLLTEGSKGGFMSLDATLPEGSSK